MAARKSFKKEINDPVLNFISIPEEIHPVESEGKKKEEESKPDYQEYMKGYEARSKRVQVLMRPSLYEKLKKLSLKEGVSVNSLINYFLENGIEEPF